MKKRLFCAALAAVVATGLFTVVTSAPANALPTNLSVTPSDPTPNATTALSFNISNYQTSTAMKCIQLQYSGGYKAINTLYSWDSSAQGWSNAWGQIVSTGWDSSHNHSGTGGSLAMTGQTSPSSDVGFASNFAYSSTQNFSGNGNELSLWVYVPATNPGAWNATIFFQDGSYNLSAGGGPVTTGQWTKVTFVAPLSGISNTKVFTIQIDSINGGGSNQTVYIDDLQQGFPVNAQPSGTDMPNGMTVGSSYIAGSYTSANSFAYDNTLATTGTMAFNYSGGATPTGSSAGFLNSAIIEPSTPGGQSVFVTMTSYTGVSSNGLCTGTQLDGPVVFEYATNPATTVSVTVDPTFTFGVAGQASTCNGDTNWITGVANATSVPIGHMSTGNIFSAGQALTVSSNAGGGFSVYIRGTQASQNLRSASHNFTDVSGTYAAPAAIGTGERFGFTWKDSTSSTSVTNPGSGALAALTNATTNKIMGSATSASGTGCVGYDVQTGPATPAGSYSAAIIYTAVPVF